MRTVDAALLRPTVRTMPWRAIGAAGAPGLLLAAAPRLTGGQATARLALDVLRASAAALALGAAFVLDDPARHTTAAVPTRRAVRHGLRVLLVVPVAAVWWTAALLLVPAPVRPGRGDHPGGGDCPRPRPGRRGARGPSRGRRPAGSGGRRAPAHPGGPGPAADPRELGAVHDPGRHGWAADHDRWAVLLCAALLVGAVCATEPRRRLTLRGLRSPSGTSGPSRA